jgi:hypothetical protein
MTRLLLALTLALSPALVLAAEPAAVKGCCQRPFENPPRAPQKRALCSGNLWSLAQHGRCVAGVTEPGEAGVCREAVFSTLVMVKEYSLSWDERLKECVLVSTGRSWPTVVAACDGNSC